jgi:hypothetical protein
MRFKKRTGISEMIARCRRIYGWGRDKWKAAKNKGWRHLE